MLCITKILSFEAAHMLSDYKGACSNIHGHSYKLHVTVRGKMNKNAMLIDFKELKKIISEAILDELDHALILKKNDANVYATKNIVTKIFWLEEEPTVEYLTKFIGDRIKKILTKNNIRLHGIKIYETDSSYAEITYPSSRK